MQMDVPHLERNNLSRPSNGKPFIDGSSDSADTHNLRDKLIFAFRLNRKKQLTLERINKYNSKLMEEIKTPRVEASNCALMVIDYTEKTQDPLLPDIWGYREENKFKIQSQSDSSQKKVLSHRDYNNVGSNDSSDAACCVIM